MLYAMPNFEEKAHSLPFTSFFICQNQRWKIVLSSFIFKTLNQLLRRGDSPPHVEEFRVGDATRGSYHLIVKFI